MHSQHSVITETDALAARLKVEPRDVRPFIAEELEVITYLSGGDPPGGPPLLLTFKIPTDCCALLTGLRFRSRAYSLGGGDGVATAYPETYAEIDSAVEGIGWRGKSRVRVDTATGNVLKLTPAFSLQRARLYVVLPPGSTVAVTHYADQTGENETSQLWWVDTFAEGYLLPERVFEDAGRSNTILL